MPLPTRYYLFPGIDEAEGSAPPKEEKKEKRGNEKQGWMGNCFRQFLPKPAFFCIAPRKKKGGGKKKKKKRGSEEKGQALASTTSYLSVNSLLKKKKDQPGKSRGQEFGITVS